MTDFLNTFSLGIIAIIITVIFSGLALFLFSAPGGPAEMAGRFLAAYCQASGVCEFTTLMQAFAIANIILGVFASYFFIAIIGAAFDVDKDDSLDDIQDQIDTVLSRLDCIDHNTKQL